MLLTSQSRSENLKIDYLADHFINHSPKLKEGEINDETDFIKCKATGCMPCKASHVLSNDSGRLWTNITKDILSA